jgi:hypothetical protein
MSRDLARLLVSRRQLLCNATTSGGTLFLLSQVTGIPIPVLLQVEKALAQGTPVRELKQKMFVMVTNADAIRPNDFNMHSGAQPQFLTRNWPDAERVPVTHRDGQTLMFPPGIGGLARYGNRMSVFLGVDTFSSEHGQGNMNSSTNVTAGQTATSIHTIIGRVAGAILPGVAFTGTTSWINGTISGGVSPEEFLQSRHVPNGIAGDVLNRSDEFRNAFHNDIVKELSTADQKVIERYWESHTAFQESKDAAQSLFNQAAPANNLAGQLEMARRIFRAGLASTFHVDGTGGQGFAFDTHAENRPQQTLARTMSDTIANFLDRVAAEEPAGQLDSVTIMITSAFGRSPTFNGAGGDDHLPSNGHVTVIGPDFQAGSWGRTTNTQTTVRGATGWAVDPSTGEIGGSPSQSGFVELNSSTVLKSVVETLGTPKAAVDAAFPGIPSLPFVKKA